MIKCRFNLGSTIFRLSCDDIKIPESKNDNSNVLCYKLFGDSLNFPSSKVNHNIKFIAIEVLERF